MNGQIVKIWQPFLEIQDGGEFFQICISDVIDMFQIKVPMFPLILVTMGQILKKWQHCFEIQEGGSRHLEKYTSGLTTITRNDFLVCYFQSKI